MPKLEPARLSGFGGSNVVEGLVGFPASVEEVSAMFEAAQSEGRRAVLRGAGRSYGDAAYRDDAVHLDFRRFNRILNWDSSTGLVEAEPGVTIEQLWRRCLPDGWWPPVVSGTMFPTLGGALAMNIHGKNAYRAGTLGDHVRTLDVLFPNGELRTLTPDNELFYAVISSAGLLGAIVRVELQMKRVSSGRLQVVAESVRDWPGQFEAFERHRSGADYMVSWIDAFGEGRGQFHAANHLAEPEPSTLDARAQDLPSRTLGIVPKSLAGRSLKLLNNRAGMRLLNWAKHMSGAARPRHTYRQSLVAFSFLLDYVPEWERAYQPGGFLQYQCFIPDAEAKGVFPELTSLQRSERLENFLTVMKRHRRDRFLFSHGVDGYSLAMDFKVDPERRNRLEALCHQMNEIVLNAGGRFYFAKDITLRPADVERYLGKAALRQFRDLKSELDPQNLLTSSLAQRTGLDPG